MVYISLQVLSNTHLPWYASLSFLLLFKICDSKEFYKHKSCNMFWNKAKGSPNQSFLNRTLQEDAQWCPQLLCSNRVFVVSKALSSVLPTVHRAQRHCVLKYTAEVSFKPLPPMIVPHRPLALSLAVLLPLQTTHSTWASTTSSVSCIAWFLPGLGFS